MILTECWGISKIPGGYVAGCGQGQEGCKNSQVDQSVVEQGTLRPGHFFLVFKMPDGRAPRGRPSRGSIPSPSIVCRYIRAYVPTYTIDRELTFC